MSGVQSGDACPPAKRARPQARSRMAAEARCNTSTDSSVVQAGDTAIYMLHDEIGSMLSIDPAAEQKIGRRRYGVKPLIGAPYGSVFEMQSRSLELVGDEYEILSSVPEVATDLSVISGDNSKFNDSNTAQKLKDTDIHRMRDEGASGNEIIRSLIHNSESWNSKSQFAQQKWLARKQKRYVRRMRIVRCTPHTLCDTYHAKSADKISNMRAETLAQLMSHGGVHAGANVLVFESMNGIVVGSAAYRMNGMGSILAAYGGQQPHFDLIDKLNLNITQIDIMQTVPSEELGLAADHLLEHGFMLRSERDTRIADAIASEQARIAAATRLVEEGIKAGSLERPPGDPNTPSEFVMPSTRASTLPHKMSGRIPEHLERSRAKLRSGINGLIIASKFDPLTVLKEAIVLLLPSSPFAIYCEFMEPLVECYMYLHQNVLAVRMQLSDTWKREFQTLPGRVHPQMRMPTSGGYILSGIYVSGKVQYKEDMGPIEPIAP